MRDREHPFTEVLIVGETGVVVTNLLVLAKVSSLVQILPFWRNYELVENLWSQFVLAVEPMNIEITWTCDDVKVNSADFIGRFRNFSIFSLLIWFCSVFSKKLLPPKFSRVVGWAQKYLLYSFEIQERGCLSGQLCGSRTRIHWIGLPSQFFIGSVLMLPGSYACWL